MSPEGIDRLVPAVDRVGSAARTAGRRVVGKAVAAAGRALQDPTRRARVPLTSEVVGPPRRTASFGVLSSLDDVHVEVVTGPEPLVAPTTTWHGPGPAPAERHGDADRPLLAPLAVAEVPGARVVLPHGWAIGPRDALLTDALFGWDRPDEHWVQRLAHARPTSTLSGRTVSLLSDYAVTNWVHFLCDALPRVRLLELAGIDVAAADRVLVPGMASATARWAVQRVLPGARIEWVSPDDGGTVACEELVVTSIPGALARYPAWVPAWLRDLVPAEVREAPSGRPVLLLGSGDGDAVLGDGADGSDGGRSLAAVLEDRGFLVVHAGAGMDEVRALQTAPVVVGVHGSAMASCCFCRPGTTVVELVPTGAETAYVGSLLSSLGVNHHSLGVVTSGTNGRTVLPDAGRVTALLDQLTGSV